MKRKGPLITLAAGVVVAAALMVLNLNATKDGRPTAAAPTTPAAQATTAPAPAPTTQAPVVAEPPATYAGYVGGGGASIAIAVKDGHAIAYLCDGRSAEAWLQGTAQGGTLALTGADNTNLTGSYANGVASGTVTAVGRQWTFSVNAVQPPSGLYRAAVQVANAQIVGGWIVLDNGAQVGTQRQGTSVTAAPPLNLTDQTAVLGDVTVHATLLDGTKL